MHHRRSAFFLVLILSLCACSPVTPCPDDNERCLADLVIAEDLAGRADIDAQDIDRLPTPENGEELVFVDTVDHLPRTYTFEAKAGDWLDVSVYARNFHTPTFRVQNYLGDYERWSPVVEDNIRAQRTVYIPSDGTYKLEVDYNYWEGYSEYFFDRIDPSSFVGVIEKRQAPQARPLDLSEPITGRIADLQDNLFSFEHAPEGDVFSVPSISYEGHDEYSAFTALIDDDGHRFYTEKPLLVPDNIALLLIDQGHVLIDHILLGPDAADATFEITPTTVERASPGQTRQSTHSLQAGELLLYSHTNLEDHPQEISFLDGDELLATEPRLQSSQPGVGVHFLTQAYYFADQSRNLSLHVRNNLVTPVHRHLEDVEIQRPHDVGPLAIDDELSSEIDEPLDAGDSTHFIFTTEEDVYVQGSLRFEGQAAFFLLSTDGTNTTHFHRNEYGRAGFFDVFLPAGTHLIRLQAMSQLSPEIHLNISAKAAPPPLTHTEDLQPGDLLTLSPLDDDPIYLALHDRELQSDQVLAQRFFSSDEDPPLFFVAETETTVEIHARGDFDTADTDLQDLFRVEVDSTSILGPLEPFTTVQLPRENTNLLLEIPHDIDVALTEISPFNPHTPLQLTFHSLDDHGATSYVTGSNLLTDTATLPTGRYLVPIELAWLNLVKLSTASTADHRSGLTTAAPIADNDPDGTTLSLEISDPPCADPYFIEALIGITHGWIGDLHLTLISPAGQAVTLRHPDGDDAQSHQARYPHFTPSAEPFDVLLDDDSRQFIGEWNLVVVDTSPFHTGQIDHFSLLLHCQAP